MHLYRIVQEALSNAMRHAHASEVSVCIKQSGSDGRHHGGGQWLRLRWRRFVFRGHGAAHHAISRQLDRRKGYRPEPPAGWDTGKLFRANFFRGWRLGQQPNQFATPSELLRILGEKLPELQNFSPIKLGMR